jgi:N-acetylneuraminate synthase
MKTRFVAEVSSNHCVEGLRRGSAEHLRRALAFVDKAADLGCAAVKFQQFRVRELFAPQAFEAHPFLLEREAWELPESFNEKLAARARERGIHFASTPFYAAAVDLLAPLVDFFKVASYQVLWLDLLARVARTGKPVVLATGMASLEEVKGALECLRANGCKDLTLLHCVSLYPTPVEEANLAAIATLRETLRVPVGWSDHSRNATVVERAVRRFGAAMVEFHLDLDGKGVEYLGQKAGGQGGHCWLPGEINWPMRNLERHATGEQRKHPADGDGRKEPCAAEGHERSWRTDPSDGLRPLLHARRALRGEAVA